MWGVTHIRFCEKPKFQLFSDIIHHSQKTEDLAMLIAHDLLLPSGWCNSRIRNMAFLVL
jgi:hypothetical protein